jgi:hypothetical protein
MISKFLLYIDIASIIDESNHGMELNLIRKNQFIHGLSKLFEYNFEEKGCDILITDNTTNNLYNEITELLPKDTIVRCFQDNRFGSINKGAGLVQKWLYNKDILEKYEWVIHFEGRLLLQNFSFFDRFFNEPAVYFRYGDPENRYNFSHFFTGLFSVKTVDLFDFCNVYPIDKLIRHSISIEYPMKDYFIQQTKIINDLQLIWFCSRKNPYYL